MKNRFLAGLIPLALATAALGAERPQDRWSLFDLYPDTASWNADVAKTEAQLKQFGACRGHLGESAARLRKCLDLEYDLLKRYARLSTYASELESEDTGKSRARRSTRRRRCSARSWARTRLS